MNLLRLLLSSPLLTLPIRTQRCFCSSTFIYPPRSSSLISQSQKSLLTPVSHLTQPLWASPKECRKEKPQENRKARVGGYLNNADKRGEAALRIPPQNGNHSNGNCRKGASQPQHVFPIYRDVLSLRWETLPPTANQLKMADRFFLQHTPEFLWSAAKFKTIEFGNVPEV